MRYSNDLRQRAMVLHFEEKKNLVEVSKLLKIAYNTLKEWKRIYKKNPNNLYTINYSTGRPRLYDYEELAEYVKKYPDKYIREIKQEVFEAKGKKASFGGIFKALNNLKIDFKKNSTFQRKK